MVKNTFSAILLCLTFLISALTQCVIAAEEFNSDLRFSYKAGNLSETQKHSIENEIAVAERDVRFFFPTMTQKINFTIDVIDWDLAVVGGVTGVAMRHLNEAHIKISISKHGEGGIEQSIQEGLRSTVLHELHHVARGWAIEDNKFGPGIHIAAVNEGLAVVFFELLTGKSHPANQGPNEVRQWVDEIMQLPIGADYMHWVSGEHPDGRFAIGYKAGRYIAYEALRNSKKTIVELSLLSVAEILKAAGISQNLTRNK